MYTMPFAAVAVVVAQDLWELLMPADAVGVLHRLELSQETEFGDANAEMIDCSISRVTGAPTSGSGGSTVTPVPGPGDAAAGIVAEINNTTELSGGTEVLQKRFQWHVAGGFEWVLTPEERAEYTYSPATRCLITLKTAPDDSITMSGTVTMEEVGG